MFTTFLAGASAIINSRPLVPTSSYPEYPLIITPYTLLILKLVKREEPLVPFNKKDAYTAQWKRAQHLADIFWKWWRKEYIQTLQNRKRWTRNQSDLAVGDVVLMKDKGAPRFDWKMAVGERVLLSVPDKRVRKVELRLCKDSSNTNYKRPVTENVQNNSAKHFTVQNERMKSWDWRDFGSSVILVTAGFKQCLSYEIDVNENCVCPKCFEI